MTSTVDGRLSSPPKLFRIVAALLMVAVVALFAFITYAVFTYHSLAVFFATVSGQTLYVPCSEERIGVVDPKSTSIVHFDILNLSDNPISLTGSSSTCSCTVMAISMPYTIRPKERLRLQISITAPQVPEEFRQTISLYTNVEEEAELSLSIVGRVRGSRERLVRNSRISGLHLSNSDQLHNAIALRVSDVSFSEE